MVSIFIMIEPETETINTYMNPKFMKHPKPKSWFISSVSKIHFVFMFMVT